MRPIRSEWYEGLERIRDAKINWVKERIDHEGGLKQYIIKCNHDRHVTYDTLYHTFLANPKLIELIRQLKDHHAQASLPQVISMLIIQLYVLTKAL